MTYDHPEVIDAVRRALAEDIGPGDVTSQACVPAAQRARGQFLAREPQVLAGMELLRLIYGERGGVEGLEILRSERVRGGGRRRDRHRSPGRRARCSSASAWRSIFYSG